MTPTEFGIVSSMIVLQTILVIFFTLSLDRSIMRLYFDCTSDKDKKDFLGTITISIIFISLIGLFLSFLFNDYIGMMFKSIEFSPYFVFAILTTFLSVFSLVPKKYMMLKEKAAAFITISLIEFALSAGFILWFLMIQNEGAVGYLKGRFASQLVLAPVFLIISYKTINLQFNATIFSKAASFSFPIIPAIITGWVLELSDRIFIAKYFTLEDVGIYSLGYKIAGVALILGSGISRAIEPVFFKLANSNDQIESRLKISKMNNIYLLITFNFCFVIALFSKEIITLMFSDFYSDAYLYIQLIAFSYLFKLAGAITSRFYQQSKKMKANMYISMAGIILNIILNFLLIPPFGPLGAAYATIITMAVGFTFSYLYAKKHCYFVPIKTKMLIIIITIYSFIVIYSHYGLNTGIYHTLIIKMIIIGVISAIYIKKFNLSIRSLLSKL